MEQKCFCFILTDIKDNTKDIIISFIIVLSFVIIILVNLKKNINLINIFIIHCINLLYLVLSSAQIAYAIYEDFACWRYVCSSRRVKECNKKESESENGRKTKKRKIDLEKQRESVLPGERDRSKPRSPLSRFTGARASISRVVQRSG